MAFGTGILDNNFKYCPNNITVNGVTRNAGSILSEGVLGALFPCVQRQGWMSPTDNPKNCLMFPGLTLTNVTFDTPEQLAIM